MRWILFFIPLFFGLTVACGAPSGPEADPGLIFSELRAESIGPSRALIRFHTSRLTSCEVEYGVSNFGLHATDPSMSPGTLNLEHNVPLEDLLPASVYQYRALATDDAGRSYRSDPLTFMTLEDSGAGPGRNRALRSGGSRVLAVSSNYGGVANDQIFGANAALDGKMSSEWASAGDGDGAFLELELAAAAQLVAVGIRSRSMSDGSSIVERFQLQISDAAGGVGAGSAVQILGPFETPDPTQSYRFEFNAPVNARSVRFESLKTSGGNTGLKELQLFE